jgi:DnaJ domain
VEKTPFSVLDLHPDTDLEIARSRYRKLAHKHHPDNASKADKQAATRVMAELNWAMEELEQNYDRWRNPADGGQRSATLTGDHSSEKPVKVAPTFVVLSTANRFEAVVTAVGDEPDGNDVRLRYESGLITIQRLMPSAGMAKFKISLAPGVHELTYPLNERVYARAAGRKPVELTVAIEPSAAEVAETPQEIISRSSSGLILELTGWALVFLGAIAAVIYVL